MKPHQGGQAEQVRAWWMPGCNLRSKSHWGCSSRGKIHAAGMPEHPWERAHHQNPGSALVSEVPSDPLQALHKAGLWFPGPGYRQEAPHCRGWGTSTRQPFLQSICNDRRTNPSSLGQVNLIYQVSANRLESNFFLLKMWRSHVCLDRLTGFHFIT